MRRRFLLLAAPAIVSAPSLMRVSAAVLDMLGPGEQELALPSSLSDLITETIRRRSHLIAEMVHKNNAILKVLRDRNHLYVIDESRLIFKPLVTKG